MVGISALLLFFCLAPATFSRRVFGEGLFRHSVRPSRDEGSIRDDEKEARTLEAGKPIKRELSGGQKHRYLVNMNTGQFLKVIVEQQGIDVVVQASGPDGKQILEFDSETRPQGREEVSVVAEAAGFFLFTVSPRLNAAPAGSYEIRIEELRDTTDTDRALHDSHKRLYEALKLHKAGKYDEALPFAERALEIRERLLGPEHPDVAVAIDGLAFVYTYRGEFVKASALFQSSLDIREKALGKDHSKTADSLNNVAEIYYYQGKHKEAEPFLKRALDIREKALGKDHPKIADSLHYLAGGYQAQARYDEAEPLFKRALDITEKALGNDHSETGARLNSLANLYVAQGKYNEAEPLYKRALDIYEKALGKDHPLTAVSLSNLAGLYYSQGRYLETEHLYKRALEIQEKALGKDHSYTANTLDNLAHLYTYQGKYAAAEPLHKRALDAREKALGKDHPDTAFSLNNLASLCRLQGKYEEAEALYKRALEIREKALGKDHPTTALSLNDLALLLYLRGRHVEAESLFKRALAITEKALGKDHPHTAINLNNLAKIYLTQGNQVAAELLFKHALALAEKARGKNHPDTATNFSNLGTLYQTQGKYVKSELVFERALEIREKALGKDHPDTVASMNNLAMLYAAKVDLVQAVKFQSLANAAIERYLAYYLLIGSERDKLAYLNILSEQTDRTISLHVDLTPNDPAARNLAATMILQRKGRALDATSQNLNALRNRFNAEDRALLDRLTETRAQIARLVLRGPQKMSVEQHQARIKELEEQAEKDEADISRSSKEFFALSLPVTLEAVQAAIPDDSALIEFATYRPFNAQTKNYGQPRYVVYVLRHGGEIQFTELGEAKSIDRSIAALRNALRDSKSADVKRLARDVDAQVFQPIRPLLGAKSRLLISPDGSLNLIPFAALVDERGRYAVERYSISYLTSGRDLLRLQAARESKGGPLVVAAPDFGSRNQVEASLEKQVDDAPEGKVRAESARSAINDFYFPPLPHAEQEGEALSALLPGAVLLHNGEATKAALNQIQAPRLLHIATHGFFLEDLDFIPAGGRGAQALGDDPERALVQLEQRGVRVESPLLRSGLVLAGANEHKEDDNGILTALEVTGLNLWGTKLVTLSACDTGVGEVKNGDGVHGMRRALVLAGSETQIMSLWSVSDKATMELMVSYYQRLQEGQGRGEALRQAQLEMLRKVNRRHPYYWACFIQSGEWANLDGKR
jgi:tetratricopeptide (TPR) repeat protein